MSSFSLKLKRNDVAIDDLPEITEAMLVAPPDLKRPDWNRTVNDITVQYSQRLWAEISQTLGNPGTDPIEQANSAWAGNIGRPSQYFNASASQVTAGISKTGGDTYIDAAVFNFVNFPIAGGSRMIVDSAILMMTKNGTGTLSENWWYYCNQLDPASPTNLAEYLALPFSTTRVLGEFTEDYDPDWPGYQGLDITDMVQEAIWRTGWIRGNNLMLMTWHRSWDGFSYSHKETIYAFGSAYMPFMALRWHYEGNE